MAGSTWKASMESPPRTRFAAACTSARTPLASCRRRSLTWDHSTIATTGAITASIPVMSLISFLLRASHSSFGHLIPPSGKRKSAVDVGKRRRLIGPALALGTLVAAGCVPDPVTNRRREESLHFDGGLAPECSLLRRGAWGERRPLC